MVAVITFYTRVVLYLRKAYSLTEYQIAMTSEESNLSYVGASDGVAGVGEIAIDLVAGESRKALEKVISFGDDLLTDGNSVFLENEAAGL